MELVQPPVAELVGQAVQGAAPGATLNVPASQAVATPPSGPVNPAAATQAWFPTSAFVFPTPHGKQLLLPGDGSKAAVHSQVKAMGSALVDTLTALATQEQWLDPAAVALLR